MASPPGRGWLRPLVWTAAGVGLAVGLSVLWLEDFAFRSAFLSSDYAGINRVMDRLAWFGRDNSAARMLAARGAGGDGDWGTAFDALGGARDSARPPSCTPTSWMPPARAIPRRSASSARRTASCAAAPGLRNQLAWMLATSGDPRVRQPEEAVGLAESLVRDGQKSDANSLDTLAAAYAAAGRFDEAIRIATQAGTLAQQRGETEIGDQIRSRLALYRDPAQPGRRRPRTAPETRCTPRCGEKINEALVPLPAQHACEGCVIFPELPSRRP